MVKNIFRFGIFAILCSMVLVIITPVLTLNSILYPVKIDSSFVRQEQIAYEKLLQKGKADSGRVFLYSPEQLNINYMEVALTLSDSVKINGWMALDTLRPQSPLLLIIPDIEEGAILYFPALKQFCDRGFNVCVMDMRGQGNSGGDYYDMGKLAASDLIYLIGELKKMPFIDKVAILGNRTGAAIAIKAISDSSSIADVLILQNPLLTMEYFFSRQATKKWGEFIQPVMPALNRSYEQQTGISIEEYDYEKMVSDLLVPHMMVVANYFSKKIIDETVTVYHASNYYRKRLYIERDTFKKPTGFDNSKKYYDKISSFINSSLPPKSKKSRFLKLASNKT